MHTVATADQVAQWQNVIKSSRLNLIRKMYSHVTGIDIGSNITQSIDLLPFEMSGFLPTSVIADKKFPLHVVVDNAPWQATNTIGDTTNPDDNLSLAIKHTGSGNGGQSITQNTDTVLFSTSAGKTAYIQTLTLYSGSSPTVSFEDGNTTGNSYAVALSSVPHTMTFPTPFKCATNLTLRSPAANFTLYWGAAYYEV